MWPVNAVACIIFTVANTHRDRNGFKKESFFDETKEKKEAAATKLAESAHTKHIERPFPSTQNTRRRSKR